MNTEMKMIGELYHPEISMLPIGGTYTMDIEHAIIASERKKQLDMEQQRKNAAEQHSRDEEEKQSLKTTNKELAENFRAFSLLLRYTISPFLGRRQRTTPVTCASFLPTATTRCSSCPKVSSHFSSSLC